MATKADVRDVAALRAAVDDGVAQLGRLDIVLANAGVFELQPSLELSEDAWQEMIDINLTGVWNTCKVALPHLVEGGGGSIVLTSSTAGLKGTPNTIHYTAAKHGVVGIMRTLANEFGKQSIRVNSVHPTGVDTVMIQNPKTWGLFTPDDPEPTREKFTELFETLHPLPVPYVDRWTSPTRSCSWSPTRPGTSPASPSRWTPGTPSGELPGDGGHPVAVPLHPPRTPPRWPFWCPERNGP